MNLRNSKHYTPEVYAGSMNDIMFFLLLFFLILSTMTNPSVIKLMLPKTKTTQEAMIKQPITLSMTAEKTYYINNKPIASDQLENEMASAVSNLVDPTIVLRVDNALTIQDLVDVLQIGNKLKVKMVLATKSTQK